MYPVIRSAIEYVIVRRQSALTLGQAHVSRHLASPADIDPFWEVNHGRQLTLFDLGRLGVFARTGLWRLQRQNGWILSVAGASVRFRRRVRVFDRLTMVSRFLGRDARFFYLLQTTYRRGEAATSSLYRIAVSRGARSIVPTQEVVAALGQPDWAPDLPDWVVRWIAAEADRPWPPEGPEV